MQTFEGACIKKTIAFNYEAICFAKNPLKHTRRIDILFLLVLLLIIEDISVFNLSCKCYEMIHIFTFDYRKLIRV